MDTDTVTAKTGRYELAQELGRGGMAVVFAAHDREMNRAVAIKVLAAHLAGDGEFRTRFLREARIAGSLSHHNLVRVYDITEVGDLPAIVMELVDGPTLSGGTLSLAEAAQVADGLAYAHARGVVHRDLKPGNLLRGRDGVVKIADFGIARAAEETRVTQIGTVLGTLRYLSPEQAEGREVGPDADVYSLGVVLEELLAEQPPAVRRVLEQARSREPRRRPAATQVAAALRGETLPLTAVTVVQHVQRRRGRIVAIAAALAVIGIVIGLLAANRSPSHPTPPRPIAPVSRSSDAAQQAHDLAAWIRRYSGR
ncbi:MAG TPA: serine/threonine-protein kinase [Gaiellaceae bacterium]|jgi:serine/threonine protein kinase